MIELKDCTDAQRSKLYAAFAESGRTPESERDGDIAVALATAFRTSRARSTLDDIVNTAAELLKINPAAQLAYKELI